MATAAHELKLYVGELRQLFDSLDPAPFRERDIDPQAADYIVESAREVPATAPLALQVQLGREPVTEAAAGMLREAVHEYFGQRAASKRRELRQLFRTGRRSLVIGLAFLASAVGLAQWLGGLISHEGYAWLASESLIIGGWVALWRPLEIFLYDWWPLRADARLFDRLAAMPVSLGGADVAAGGRT
ncbi:MAG: hypothetical protein JNM50_10170 [Chromatiales bacterium]|nr:hypothetical protein [Chromatiales bacterium]